MADEAQARVAQLEKEKRQRDFQVRGAAARGAYAAHALRAVAPETAGSSRALHASEARGRAAGPQHPAPSAAGPA